MFITYWTHYDTSDNVCQPSELPLLYIYISATWSLGAVVIVWLLDWQRPMQSVPLTLWVRILLRRGVPDTTLCDKVWQRLVAGRWFFPGTPVSSTNKTYRHDIAEILLKVGLNSITQLILKVWVFFNKSYLSPLQCEKRYQF